MISYFFIVFFQRRLLTLNSISIFRYIFLWFFLLLWDWLNYRLLCSKAIRSNSNNNNQASFSFSCGSSLRVCSFLALLSDGWFKKNVKINEIEFDLNVNHGWMSTRRMYFHFTLNLNRLRFWFCCFLWNSSRDDENQFTTKFNSRNIKRFHIDYK